MIEQLLRSDSLWAPFVAAFVAGLALNLTPCVYPMIPVTVAFFGGQAGGRLAHRLWLAAAYVVGISLTFAALGSLAARTGMLLGSWLQQPLVLIGVAALMIALALSMFGLYELQPPAWILQRLGQASSGAAGALLMGMSVGLVAAPCVGPFMIGMLVFVSQLARPWMGFALFFIMGLGMGLPYVLLGLAAQRTSRLPKAGPWMVWIKHALGVMLLGLALYFLRPLIPHQPFRWLSVLGLAAAGAYLGWMFSAPGVALLGRGRFATVRRLTGVALIALAVALVPRPSSTAGPSVAWQPYSAEALRAAAAARRPALVDVYADWCIPCVELDHVTFRHPGVVERLKAFATLRIDATGDVPAESQALLDRYGIIGVPTVLILDADGREREDLRVTGFVPPDRFLQRLDRLQ
jgi:thiol:disulfide interchange protein DsbD